MTDTQQTTRQPRPWGKVLATVLTSLAVGPPVGAVVFTFSIMIYMWFGGKPQADGNGFAETLLGSFFVLLFAVPFSYVLGGLQAFGTGVVFSVYGWWRGSVPWWLAVVAGVVMFGGMLLVGGIEDLDTYPLFLATHLAASLMCWLIVRNFWRVT
jgi:hypothetical protein